jgi:hypothetical protein
MYVNRIMCVCTISRRKGFETVQAACLDGRGYIQDASNRYQDMAQDDRARAHLYMSYRAQKGQCSTLTMSLIAELGWRRVHVQGSDACALAAEQLESI